MRIKETIQAEELECITVLQLEQQADWRNTPPAGRTEQFAECEFLVLPGVFPPRSDTALLVRNLPVEKGSIVLDVGTGTGVLAVIACKLGAVKCVAVDINPDAVRNAKENAVRQGVSNVMDVRVSDGLSSIGSDERFNLVIANLPGRAGEAADVVQGAQWDSGFKTHKAFFEKIAHHLRDDGKIVMAKANYPEINDLLSFSEEMGFTVRILDKRLPLKNDPRTYYVLEFLQPKGAR